jgi:hypothetical protein
MAHYKFKAKITDDIEDARNIIQLVGKAIKEGTIDKASALDNLSIALKKLDSARYYIDRE